MGVFQVALPDIFYTIAIKGVTALEAILIPVIEPILNPIWVFLLLGEAPGLGALVGGVITLAVVTALSVFKSRASPNKSHDPGTKARNIN